LLCEVLVALLGAVRVLDHDPLEELRVLVLAGVARITDVLPDVVPGLPGVVLNRDEVEAHVIEARFTGGHGDPFIRQRPAGPASSSGYPVRTGSHVPKGPTR
jgi:hypothetical protein